MILVDNGMDVQSIIMHYIKQELSSRLSTTIQVQSGYIKFSLGTKESSYWLAAEISRVSIGLYISIVQDKWKSR